MKEEWVIKKYGAQIIIYICMIVCNGVMRLIDL